MRVCLAYQVSERVLMCKGAMFLYVKCSVCYILYFYYKLSIDPAISCTCFTCIRQKIYFNHINCHYCSLKWQAFEDIKLRNYRQQLKSIVTNMFHADENLIDCVHMVHYARWKWNSEGNIEEDPNVYGCSP